MSGSTSSARRKAAEVSHFGEGLGGALVTERRVRKVEDYLNPLFCGWRELLQEEGLEVLVFDSVVALGIEPGRHLWVEGIRDGSEDVVGLGAG